MAVAGRWMFLVILLGFVAIAITVVAMRPPARSSRLPVVRDEPATGLDPGTLTLPNRATSVKFAVIGDSGRGAPPQHEIAAQMLGLSPPVQVSVRADARRQHLRRAGVARGLPAGSSRSPTARC